MHTRDKASREIFQRSIQSLPLGKTDRAATARGLLQGHFYSLGCTCILYVLYEI